MQALEPKGRDLFAGSNICITGYATLIMLLEYFTIVLLIRLDNSRAGSGSKY